MFDLKTRNRKFKTQNKYANIRIKQSAVLVRILWFIITTLRIPKVKLELSWWLNKIAKILRADRIKSGALTLASNEIRFSLDSETHDPIDVVTKELKETNSKMRHRNQMIMIESH